MDLTAEHAEAVVVGTVAALGAPVGRELVPVLRVGAREAARAEPAPQDLVLLCTAMPLGKRAADTVVAQVAWERGQLEFVGVLVLLNIARLATVFLPPEMRGLCARLVLVVNFILLVFALIVFHFLVHLEDFLRFLVVFFLLADTFFAK